MTVSSHYRGHLIIFEDGVWVYADTNKKVSDEGERPCGNCGMERTEEGYDGCIGELGGVINACCGHGVEEEAYIVFEDWKELRGREAINYFKGVGGKEDDL